MSNITKWEVENKDFWEQTGNKIAYRNLWISIFCPLLNWWYCAGEGAKACC